MIPILNNSDITGKDLYHDTLIGLPYFILNCDEDIMRSVLNIRNNHQSFHEKTKLISCMVNTHTDVARRGRDNINRKTIVSRLERNTQYSYRKGGK